jgi:hypothetical protein
MREKLQRLSHRLRNQHAIKRIAMYGRQCGDGQCVLCVNRQNIVAGLTKRLKRLLSGNRHTSYALSPKCKFDGDFANGHDADCNVV